MTAAATPWSLDMPNSPPPDAAPPLERIVEDVSVVIPRNQKAEEALGVALLSGLAASKLGVEPLGKATNTPPAKDAVADGTPVRLPIKFTGDCGGQTDITMTPDGRFIYIAAFGEICAFRIDYQAKVANPVPGMPFKAATQTDSIALDRSGAYLYTANYAGNSVSAFALDPATGALRQVPGSPYSVGKEPLKVVVDGSGRYVYVANRSGNSISGFRIDIETGGLTPVPGSPFAAPEGPWPMAADPKGRYLFVSGSGNVQVFRIDAATGALTATGPPMSPYAYGLAVDPTGRIVYATQYGDPANVVATYAIGPSGALTPLGTPVAADQYVEELAVSPSGANVYAVKLAQEGSLFGYHADPATGALTPIAGSPFPMGQNPYAVTTVGKMPTVPLWSLVGAHFGRPIAVGGGRPPYAFAVTSGTLPPGLALDAATGFLSGTFTTPGAYDYGVQVTDSAGAKATRSFTFTIQAAPAPAIGTAIEFHNQSLDHYFITHVADEIAKLDAGTVIKGWARTSKSFPVYTAAKADTSPVCRYYIPPGLGDSHFFGRGSVECNATGQKNPSFVLEDPAFMHMVLPAAGVCPANTINVHRVFSNRPDANHRYMTDKATRDAMVAQGWLAEGDGPDLVVMCAPA
ncbi:MAG: beta-propeller fold lactonase family protein [Burkholderiales bacterium]|nr:beta-propeller fold lactonase family protein [Burkholderiales bacterium]